MKKMKKPAAFTLAEVLITLAIIGVVAALTIPTVITNYQKKMYVTQLKKTYNNLTNAFKTLMANEEVEELTETSIWSKISSSEISTNEILQPKNADLKNEFFKILKVTAVYDEGNIPEKYNPEYKGLNGDDIGPIDSAVYLADGTLLYFNLLKTPDVVSCGSSKECSSLKEFQETKNTKTKLYSIAAAFVLDVNGVKGPNVFGRDLFEFYLGNDGVLYPFGGADIAVGIGCEYDNLDSCEYYWKNESGEFACAKSSDGTGCAGRIMEEGWEMKY